MLTAGVYGTLPPVGGAFACPGCLTAVPGYNPAFGKVGAIPPFPGYGPLTAIPGYNRAFGTFGAIPPFPGYGPLTGIPGYNPYIGGYPGICTGCV